jgi:hypothetical protein
MKNKGRYHKATRNDVGKDGLGGIANCKGMGVYLTRPIGQMSSRTKSIGKMTKHDKKNWGKRVRGYFKSQTKEIL